MLSSFIFEKPLPKVLDHLASSYVYASLLHEDPTCWELLPVTRKEIAEYANLSLSVYGINPDNLDRNPEKTFSVDNRSREHIINGAILLLLRTLPYVGIHEKIAPLKKLFAWW